MSVKRLDDHVYLIDLKPAGLESFIGSYVVKGVKKAIIETGPTSTVDNLLDGLKEISVKENEVELVMVSHIHLDHAGGAGTLLRHLPNAKLIVHPRGAPHMANPEKLWSQSLKVLGKIARIYGEVEPVPEDRIIPAADGMLIDLGDGVELEVVGTPGHASHHVSYYQRNGTLFPGDTAGIYLQSLDVTIPTTPPVLYLDKILGSIDKLVALKPERLCYTHFGPAERAVERLRSYASQLKLWASTIHEGIKKEENLETTERKILERDPFAKAAKNYVLTHPLMGEHSIKRNIQGFIEYFKKFPQASPPG